MIDGDGVKVIKRETDLLQYSTKIVQRNSKRKRDAGRLVGF